MIWTISDLHLSSVQPKPMDVFGHQWKNHTERIATQWRERVQHDDWVLIAGDISWAMKLTDAIPDLQWIDALPGRKVMIKGNHDYWWDRLGQVNPFLPPSIIALQANATRIDGAVVCGTRGWITPETMGFDPAKDERIYQREVGRLDRALTEARALATHHQLPIIVMIHYPPFINQQPTEFARRIQAAGASSCIYGHMHRADDWAVAVQERVNNVYYQLTACDYLRFGPVMVRGLQS